MENQKRILFGENKKNQNKGKIHYSVIPRTLIFLFHGSSVLLIKHKTKDKIGFGKWNGIGGHVEENENPLFAARREVREETGLRIKELLLKYIIIIPEKENMGVCLFIFSGNSRNTSVRESSEGELRWIGLDQINQYPVMNDLPIILDLIIKSENKDGTKILSYLENKGRVQIKIVD